MKLILACGAGRDCLAVVAGAKTKLSFYQHIPAGFVSNINPLLRSEGLGPSHYQLHVSAHLRWWM
jgi:hypothetical protein